MAGGTFFQPKNLTGLDPSALFVYRDECDDNLRRIQQDFAYLNGRRSVLSDGFSLDGVLAIGGVMLAGAGIAITAIATFGGALALAGGAFSLLGAHRYGDRLIERNLVTDQVESRRQSIAFWNNELARIEDELTRKGIP